MSAQQNPALSASEMTPERLAEVAAVLVDVDACIALLPAEERAEYERCQQSVIDARRYAERHAHEHWIG